MANVIATRRLKWKILNGAWIHLVYKVVTNFGCEKDNRSYNVWWTPLRSTVLCADTVNMTCTRLCHEIRNWSVDEVRPLKWKLLSGRNSAVVSLAFQADIAKKKILVSGFRAVLFHLLQVITSISGYTLLFLSVFFFFFFFIRIFL